MTVDELPSISIVIPTFNNARTIEECLSRIFLQDYPRDKLEVIVVDGMSTDGTMNIVKKYPVCVIQNKNRIEQGRFGGRDLGYRIAHGELIAWIDADNFIIGDKWLRSMVEILLSNPEIFAVEPRPYAKDHIGLVRYLSYTTRGQDSFMCTLLYDWNAIPHSRRKGYDVFTLTPETSVGAGCCNGLVIRKALIDKTGGFDYDIDVVFRIVSLGNVKLARADTYYIHETVGSFTDFMKKRYRIISEYFYYRSKRNFPWDSIVRQSGFLRYTLSSLLLVGSTGFAVKKYRIVRDRAWFYHPLASFITVMIYALYIVLNPRYWKKTASMLFH